MKHKGLWVLSVFFLFAVKAWGQTDIFIRGSGKLFPIAVAQLCVESGTTAADKEIPKTIGRDLDISGFFEVLDPGAYIETPGKCGSPDEIAYSDWSIVRAEGVVRGTVTFDGATLKAKLYLHDVQRQKIVLGKEYEGDASQAAKIGHRFANEIMRAFTGEPGVFGSQIAFSSRVGRFKELYVVDMDGSNPRQITDDKALSMSAAWSPDASRLIYTSYRLRQPDLYQVELSTRRVSPITSRGNLVIGAHYLKDGKTVIVSSTAAGGSDLLLMNLDGSVVRKIAGGGGVINVSPSLSPDQSRVAFCSNRAGGPQIYTMGMDGSDVRRVSFASSNYCTSPAWSPRGNRIAFMCRADAGFNIFVADADGSNPAQLTSYGNNEDPDWSPDGRYLVFSSTFGKGYVTSLAVMREDGSNIRQITSSRIGDSEPAWGPVVN